MKKVYIFILWCFPLISFAQVQIGQDIDGEAAGDFFGTGVSLSADGTTLAIGACFNDGDNGEDSGHVRVFENQNGNWIQIGQDIDGEDFQDRSGSVSISDNGTVLAVGARFNDGNGQISGHVRVFENINGIWMQIGQDIDGEAAGDSFSNARIDLSSNGLILAAGAPNNDNAGSNFGNVRIFEFINNEWAQIGEDIQGDEGNAMFGGRLSLSSDGNIVAISAFRNGSNGEDSGQVKVYENQNGNWVQIGQDINGEMSEELFGEEVVLSCDGSILAISAPLNTETGEIIGQVRVYENQNGNWVQIGQDVSGEVSESSLGELFGEGLALSCDGIILAVGAPENSDSETDSGQVRIYQNQNGNWIQIGQNIDGESSFDRSGFNMAFSSDSSILAIGANGNNGNGSNSGHVRVFDLSDLLSNEESTITQFELFPNPAKDILNIQLQQGVLLENINIYNNLGQFIQSSKELIVDISDLSQGVYFIEVNTNQGKSSKKLIIE